MNVQRLTLDLDKSSVPRGRVTIAQCDHDGTTVEAEIYDNGIALDTSGLSAYLVMRLPDGRHYYRVPATLDGHVATAIVDEAYAATVTGTTEIAYFELVGSGATYSTSRFGVRVLPSATADATVPETWDGEVERLIQQLDDAIETATDAASVANAAAANADATADGVESRVQEMAQDAAETATADAEQRIQDAIDAMGDISELAVPLMSKDVRGGAKLEEHGGLVLRDGALGIGSLVQESDGTARGGIASLTAEGHAEQDGTPTPDSPVPIQVVRGRNLIDESKLKTGLVDSNGNLTTTATDYVRTEKIPCDPSSSYVAQTSYASNRQLLIYEWSSDGSYLGMSGYSNIGEGTVAVFETKATTAFVCVVFRHVSNPAVVSDFVGGCQLTLGFTPQPYVPYGHVGLEAQGKNLFDEQVELGGLLWASGQIANASDRMRSKQYSPIVANTEYYAKGSITIFYYDASLGFISYAQPSNQVFTAPSNASYFKVLLPDTTTYSGGIGVNYPSSFTDYEPYYHTTTPIPLPTRGWVAGLPDGTADTLMLDGAGKVTWELSDAETTTAATDGITGTVGIDVLSTTGQIADGATVLYKLATPVTEDCGYIEDWPTDIPEGALIDIPELSEVGIKFFIDSSVTELAKQWYARANSEYADRLQALESAVAELVTGA